jgi:hypothetical protein
MRNGIILAGTAASALLLAALPAGAQVTGQNFRGGLTSDLAALCGASEQEAHGQAALVYCQGFFVAAGQYHHALSAEGGAQRPVFCLPNPSPTFEQARTSFVTWARTNPQHSGERAIDGLTRFAGQTYPCPEMPDRGYMARNVSDVGVAWTSRTSRFAHLPHTQRKGVGRTVIRRAEGATRLTT